MGLGSHDSLRGLTRLYVGIYMYKHAITSEEEGMNLRGQNSKKDYLEGKMKGRGATIILYYNLNIKKQIES